MRECVAIRHLPFEDLGYFATVLQDAGWQVRYLDAPSATLEQIRELSTDLLVVLGAPLGANDENDYPFLAAERALLEARLERNLPTLGICLGAQLMARALGARVAPAIRSEIGWASLLLTPSGEKSSLRYFADVNVFHWHGDAIDVPEHALPLASTPDCPYQAFSVGTNILGLQFHPEVTPHGLDHWYVGHYRNLQQDDAPPVHQLRADAERFGTEMRKAGTRFLSEWLSQLRRS